MVYLVTFFCSVYLVVGFAVASMFTKFREIDTPSVFLLVLVLWPGVLVLAFFEHIEEIFGWLLHPIEKWILFLQK